MFWQCAGRVGYPLFTNYGLGDIAKCTAWSVDYEQQMSSVLAKDRCQGCP